MGLLQKAYETYEYHTAFEGEYASGEKKFKEPLAPVGHITTSANIEVTIDSKGKFISAALVDKKAAKIIIPVTEESSGRTSGVCPHPLCDNIGYISPQNVTKHDAYVNQLTTWAESEYSHPMLVSILNYVRGQTILADLVEAGINSPSEKDIVRWIVIGLDEDESPYCWTNKALFKAFSRYYQAGKAAADSVLCMMTGKISARADQHIKGIISINGNAKLISANDTTNFTYRGRFTNDNQAVTVGYEASQKAHNALKWIAADQGVIIGGRTFVCWNPKGKKIHHPTLPLRRSEMTVMKMTEYKNDLVAALHSYKSQLAPNDDTVIVAFDAATTGRLAVTYYNEMKVGDFFDRLKSWDESCCWKNSKFGISAPALERIVNCAFGTERNGRLETDERVMKQQIQRLLCCRMDGVAMPYDIVHALAKNTMHPQSYEKQLEYLQFTACAVIRKYYLDRYKEEYDMALEKDKKDISYQYGRLLAVLEKAERDTYESGEGRETNAIRMQSAFCAHPVQTAKTIVEQVKAGYYMKLKPGSRVFYDRLIGEIFERISSFDESEWNVPLKETYIIGYYLQKNALYTKNDTINTTEELENE